MAIYVPRFVRQLRDAEITAPADGEVLTYDSADEKWKNEVAAGGGGGPPTGAAGGVLGGTYPNPGFAVDMATQAELDAHVTDITDAHDATAVSVAPFGTIAATQVQAALEEIVAEAVTDLGPAVILAPASSARNVIQPTAGAVIAAIVKAHAAQSVDLWRWVNSADVVFGRMTSGGDFVLGSTAANGAGFQFNRSYTDPADLFKVYEITVGTTIDADDGNDLYAVNVDATLDGTGGSQAGGLSSYSAFRSHLLVASVNPDPLAYNVITARGLSILAETDPTQDGIVESLYGGELIAMHNGAGEAQGIFGFRGSAVIKGSPVVSDFGGFTNMAAVVGGIENTSTREVPIGTGFEVMTPYLGAAAGSRFTTLMGLRVNNIGGSIDAAGKTKTSYGIRIDAQADATVQSYALAALGGKSLFTDGLVIALIAAPADAAYENGEGGWWWDQANSLPKWKGKKSDGTVVNFTPSSGGAPTTATYITQTPDAGLSAEQALSALATGLVKNTTGTGVLSIGAAGTDYYAPGGTDVAIADGGTGASTAVAARTALQAHPYRNAGYKVGEYYPGECIPNQGGGGVQTVGRCMYLPFYVDVTTTFDRIAIYVITVGAAGALQRMGIYNDNAGVPGTVLLDAGTVATDAGGAGIKSITISQQLTPGRYWLCSVSQVIAATVQRAVAAGPMQWLNGSFNAQAICADSITGAFAASPAVAALGVNPTVVALRALSSP